MQINVIEYFEHGALRKCRDKVAVQDQGRDFTFAEIERFSKNLAALILKRSGSFHKPIPVFLPKSVGNIVADIGILYSGNCYANLDIKSPAQRLKGMLQNLNPEIIITTPALAPALKAIDIPESNLLLIEEAMIAEAIYDFSVISKRL